MRYLPSKLRLEHKEKFQPITIQACYYLTMLLFKPNTIWADIYSSPIIFHVQDSLFISDPKRTWSTPSFRELFRDLVQDYIGPTIRLRGPNYLTKWAPHQDLVGPTPKPGGPHIKFRNKSLESSYSARLSRAWLLAQTEAKSSIPFSLKHFIEHFVGTPS